MVSEEKTISVLIRAEHIKDLPREDSASEESLIRMLEDLNLYDKNNNLIGRLGKAVRENGKVLGLEALLYEEKLRPRREE